MLKLQSEVNWVRGWSHDGTVAGRTEPKLFEINAVLRVPFKGTATTRAGRLTADYAVAGFGGTVSSAGEDESQASSIHQRGSLG